MSIYQIRGGVHFMVIKSVNETLYGYKADLTNTTNTKRVVLQPGDAAMHAKEHEKYKTALEEKEQKEYDYEKGQDNTMHRVAVDVSTGESEAEITGVSEVSVEKASD